MIGSSLLTFETLLERQSSQDRLESGYFREWKKRQKQLNDENDCVI
jgi:hypothetical protein